MRVSIELVPRSRASLRRQVDEVIDLGMRVGLTNLPDLLRFELRSVEAAGLAREHALLRGRELAAVPHVRAMDVELRCPWAPGAQLEAAGVDEVVVIQGDPPEGGRPSSGPSTLEVIAKLRAERPGWRIYAALDPYRQGIAQELDYALRKLDAGAHGFFTQPFFDVRLLEAWRALVPDVPIFWGATSVTTPGSMRYWTSRNRAVFPRDFEPTLSWHRRFAGEVLHFAETRDVDVYFMPIRVSPAEWLGDLLG